jgi:hypothetical protein
MSIHCRSCPRCVATGPLPPHIVPSPRSGDAPGASRLAASPPAYR